MPGRDKSLITRNGIPDPQAYNPQTGQWESFIGVSWGKTAGGLYVPIRVDDQGRQEVTLSGAVALLNALSSADLSVWRGWGATVGTYAGRHLNPLDVSDYPRRLIHVRNNTDGRVESVALYMYGVAGEEWLVSEGFPDIPAGASLVIDGTNSEIIDKPYPYISLRTVARGATEGAQYVTFFGGV